MAPAYSWYLAVRYLLARWVNVLGIAGVALAVWALIVVIAVFSGFIAEIRAHIRGATADLVLTGVAKDASYTELRELLRDPDVAATAPRLQHYATLFPYTTRFSRPNLQVTSPIGSSSLQNNVVTLLGIDPELEASASGFCTWLAEVDEEYRVADPAHPLAVSAELYALARRRVGQPIEPGRTLRTPPGLLLSERRITRGERIDPGQIVDLVSARFERSAGAEDVLALRERVVVTGAYATNYSGFDEIYAFVHIDVLRGMLGEDPALLGAIDIVTEVAIRCRDGADLKSVQDRLTQRLRAANVEGVIKTWEEQNRVFLAAVDHERGLMKVSLFAVMLVAAFLIYATLHMMVTQKVKDIGILTSLGATPRGIAAIFVLCGGVIAVVGCSAGLAIGILSAHYLNDVNDWFDASFGVELFPTELYDLDRIPYRIEPDWVAQVLIAASVLALLVAYLPARRAARMAPVKALSYE